MKMYWIGGGLRGAQLIPAASEEEAKRRFLDPRARLSPQLELVAEVIATVTS